MIRLNGSDAIIYPFDRLFTGYCLVMILLITVFGRPVEPYLDELLFYLAMTALSIAIVRFVDETRNRWFALIRLAYPALLFTFFYRTTGGVMHLVSDRFFDPELIAFEQALFGSDPSLYIDRNFSDLIWANELFSFGYFSYYLMVPGFLLIAFLKRRDDIIRSAMNSLCLSFFLSYLIFVLLPVESPRWFLAGDYVHPIESPFFRPLVDFVIGAGGLRGGGMPSSHVGVGLVVLFYCFRYYRPAGWVLLPINLLLAAGTVWGRFHYVSDVLAGIVVGVIPTVIAWKFLDRRLYNEGIAQVERDLKPHHAS